MKNRGLHIFIFGLLMLVFATDLNAQNSYSTKKTAAFVEPQFPGGKAVLDKWLLDNIKFPVLAKEIGIQGTVVAEFTVSAVGGISGINIIKSIGSGCDRETIRLIENMPKWIPAKRKGTNISFKTQIRVNFGDPKAINELEVKVNYVYNKGIDAQKNGEWEIAIALYDEVIEITPYMDLDAIYNRGFCKMKLGDKEGACSDWFRAEKFGSDESKIMVKKYCMAPEVN